MRGIGSEHLLKEPALSEDHICEAGHDFRFKDNDDPFALIAKDDQLLSRFNPQLFSGFRRNNHLSPFPHHCGAVKLTMMHLSNLPMIDMIYHINHTCKLIVQKKALPAQPAENRLFL
ncbi:hypothetical protein DSY4827 [Desulfitobacterium hafniense Y51]|uniref:Uncharacterized protein n=1 Tax=Desulfitobacterium hafniense (strain Y51) TaxID=138119 RepID=Q24MX6_DESHY|nr:hypothetical protein DSY4827 [Desulfitobacterium hafniense Y51]